MNVHDWLIRSAEYGVVIPGAIMCLLPVAKRLRVPKAKFLPVFFAALTAICFLLAAADTAYAVLDGELLFYGLVAILSLAYFYAVRVEKMKLVYIVLCTFAALSFGGIANHGVEAMSYPAESEAYLGLLTQWIFCIFAVAVFFFVFRKKFEWMVDRFHARPVWAIAWISPAVIAFCTIMMVPIDYSNVQAGRILIVGFFIWLTLLVLFLLFQVLFYRIAKVTTQKLEAQTQSHLLEIQSKQYESLIGYVEQTKRLRHDFRHAICTMSTLAENGDYPELKRYIEEYHQQTGALHTKQIFCKHTTLNAVLGYYAELSQQREITTDWRVTFDKELGISDVDLCSILGNLLENALHGCMTVEPSERYINLSADTDSPGEIYIIVENSFNGVVDKRNGRYVSTKKDGGGIGISSVIATVEKYAGIARFYEQERKFHAELMLPKPMRD